MIFITKFKKYICIKLPALTYKFYLFVNLRVSIIQALLVNAVTNI